MIYLTPIDEDFFISEYKKDLFTPDINVQPKDMNHSNDMDMIPLTSQILKYASYSLDEASILRSNRLRSAFPHVSIKAKLREIELDLKIKRKVLKIKKIEGFDIIYLLDCGHSEKKSYPIDIEKKTICNKCKAIRDGYRERKKLSSSI